MQLLQSMAEAAQDVAESLQSANSSDCASESKLAWFFGIGNSIDYNASRLAASFVTYYLHQGGHNFIIVGLFVC